MPNADLYAAFYASGPGIRHNRPRYVRAIDLAPTIAYLLGFPTPSKAQGHVLTEIIVRPRLYAPGQPLAMGVVCWGH